MGLVIVTGPNMGGKSTLLRLVSRDRPDAIGDLPIGPLLIGALMHDVDHPACMNGLLVAMECEGGGARRIRSRCWAAAAR